MTHQSHSWAYIQRKPELRKIYTPLCSLLHCLQELEHGSNLDVHRQMNGQRSCGTYTQWNIQIRSDQALSRVQLFVIP